MNLPIDTGKESKEKKKVPLLKLVCYRDKLRAWAVSRNWTVTRDKNENGFIIERILKQEEDP